MADLPAPGVLSAAEIESFMRDGFVCVREAFDPAAAKDLLPQLCAEWGIDPDDRTTWQKARVLVQRSLTGGRLDHLYTKRLVGAIDDLVGIGRWRQPRGTGYVLGNLPGFDEPPWGPMGRGHVDGNHFHHHLTSPEQGLIALLMFTTVEPEGGGTWISVGSHRVVARLLSASEPAGCTPGEIGQLAHENTLELPIVEVTGQSGDLLLMHPFVYHGSSKNLGPRLRAASNQCISLHAPMRMCRPSPGEYSVVEQAIRQALMDSCPLS